jgi:hypothetical protein
MRESGNMAGPAVSEWQKGGLRYAKLKEIVPAYLAPAKVLAFFVGVRSRGGAFRLINPFTPLQREYVLAATTDGLAILRLRRPGVFRASIRETVYEGKPPIDIAWEDGNVVVDGKLLYAPIAFHQEDAQRVVDLLANES